jgi:hypothetical protein
MDPQAVLNAIEQQLRAIADQVSQAAQAGNTSFQASGLGQVANDAVTLNEWLLQHSHDVVGSSVVRDILQEEQKARDQLAQARVNGQVPPEDQAAVDGAIAAIDAMQQRISGSSMAPAPSGDRVPPIADWVQFLVWLGALVVLWLMLTALAEAGFQREAYAVAGLLIFGALVVMGPTAIDNAQHLIKTTATAGGGGPHLQ